MSFVVVRCCCCCCYYFCFQIMQNCMLKNPCTCRKWSILYCCLCAIKCVSQVTNSNNDDEIVAFVFIGVRCKRVLRVKMKANNWNGSGKGRRCRMNKTTQQRREHNENILYILYQQNLLLFAKCRSEKEFFEWVAQTKSQMLDDGVFDNAFQL